MAETLRAVRKTTKNRGKMDGRNRRARKGIAGVPGNPVTLLREEFGLNLKQFAKLLGIPYYTLAAIEYGEVKSLRPEAMLRLEKAGINEDAPKLYKEWRAEAAKRVAA